MKRKSTSPAWAKVTEIELVYRNAVKASERPTVHSPQEIYTLLLQLWNRDRMELQEEVKALFLNRRSKVLGIYHASSGGLTEAIADIRLILVAALKAGATHLVLSHNHPSGSLTPSRPDEKLTAKIKLAAGYHDIVLLDHLIVTPEGYYSFAAEGAL